MSLLKKRGASDVASIRSDIDANPVFRVIRGLIWTYLFMLLFEGAFRKWITPGLSSPLLVIRDPVVILIYLFAASAGLFPTNRLVLSLAGIGVLAAAFGLGAESFRPMIYLFGIRTNFLHLPLIFVVPRVMSLRHVVRMGRWVLILSIPMAFLIVKQFEASPEDILNTGAGGTGMQMMSSGGRVRASGTFTFIAGLVAFCGLVASFLLHSLLRPGAQPRWLQIAGAVSLIISVATSGSRSAVGAVCAVALVAVCAVVMKPRLLLRTLVLTAFVLFMVSIVVQLGVVQEGVNVMSLRFEEAGGQMGIWPRVFGSFYYPLSRIADAPLLGAGLGMGTNAGSAMATGKINFLLAEDDWSRVILESGPLVGVLFIAWRAAAVWFLFMQSLKALKSDNALPVFLLGACALLILQGQLGQPTILGFAALVGGFCLAACNDEKTEALAPAAPVSGDKQGGNSAKPRRPRRGRSVYAEALHGRE